MGIGAIPPPHPQVPLLLDYVHKGALSRMVKKREIALLAAPHGKNTNKCPLVPLYSTNYDDVSSTTRIFNNACECSLSGKNVMQCPVRYITMENGAAVKCPGVPVVGKNVLKCPLGCQKKEEVSHGPMLHSRCLLFFIFTPALKTT